MLNQVDRALVKAHGFASPTQHHFDDPVPLEVPMGFKWFAEGLFTGSYCFGGEESAGASFLERNGTAWTTDKDGPIMGLLGAEISATTTEAFSCVTRCPSARFGTTGGTPRYLLPATS
jgi:hypothetical protein